MSDARWSSEAEWLRLVTEWISARPVHSNPKGLDQSCEMVKNLLSDLGFRIEVKSVAKETAALEGGKLRDILIATRAPDEGGSDSWVGIFNHYDIEEAEDVSSWESSPFNVDVRPGPQQGKNRVYARGIGDNIGPLALRWISLKNALKEGAKLPGILWILHGEEEIGSPWAHQLFPTLKLSDLSTKPVCLWLEETGYFFNDGTQRILMQKFGEQLKAKEEILSVLGFNSQQDKVEERYLNKGFGSKGCPCLEHFVSKGNIPYVGIGPNDDYSTVHAPNESLPLSTLATSSKQFICLLNYIHSKEKLLRD